MIDKVSFLKINWAGDVTDVPLSIGCLCPIKVGIPWNGWYVVINDNAIDAFDDIIKLW